MDYLNDKIRHVATWIKANKLFIKVKKTKIMIHETKISSDTPSQNW